MTKIHQIIGRLWYIKLADERIIISKKGKEKKMKHNHLSKRKRKGNESLHHFFSKLE